MRDAGRDRVRRVLRVAAIAIAVLVLVPAVACLTRPATGEGPWRIEQSRIPRVAIRANEIKIADARLRALNDAWPPEFAETVHRPLAR
jgi:hypothetical protein